MRQVGAKVSIDQEPVLEVDEHITEAGRLLLHCVQHSIVEGRVEVTQVSNVSKHNGLHKHHKPWLLLVHFALVVFRLALDLEPP